MADGRAKDLLDAKDYAKILRGNVTEIKESDFNVIKMDKIVENYRDFFVDVAAQTSRMNEGPLRQGTLKNFEVSPELAEAFARRLVQAFRHCADKARYCSSGKKLSPAVAAVAKVLVLQKRKEAKVKKNSPKKPSMLPVEKNANMKSGRSPVKSPGRVGGKGSQQVETPKAKDTTPKAKNTKAKDMLKTPQKPRKVPTHQSPTWSLPATPRPTPQRGVPAESSDPRGMPAATDNTALAIVPAESPGKTPRKRPAAKATGVMKRPSSTVTSKAPQKQQVQRQTRAKSEEVWKASKSFGYVKLGCFTQKSYIVFKANMNDKPALLVNVQGKNVPHKKLALDLFQYVLQGGLTKEQACPVAIGCEVRRGPPDPEACPVGSMAGDEPAAYMGPLQLPEGAGYLTPQQRQDILAEYGVVAVVRSRSQWGGRRALSLSGPVDQLVPARRRVMELLDIDNLETVNRSKASGAPPEQLRQRTATWDEQSDRRPAPRQRGAAKAAAPKGASSAAGSVATPPWGDAGVTGWAWGWGPHSQWWSYPPQPMPYGYGYWQQMPSEGARRPDDDESSSSTYPRRRRRETPTEPKRPPRQPPGITAGLGAKPAAQGDNFQGKGQRAWQAEAEDQTGCGRA
eukprot:s1279_g15.t1